MNDRMVRDQEAANVAACLEAATAAGHTPEEAEGCDDGNVGCPGCPWRKAMEHNGVQFTEEEYAEFCKLVRGVESQDQVTRINARLDQPAFVAKHGREKCDAMYVLLCSKEK